MVVGVAPYLDLQWCFKVHANHDIVFLWVLLIMWDARKCECAIHVVPPPIEKVSSVDDVDVGTCLPSLCEIPVFVKSFSARSYSQYQIEMG